MTTASTPTGAEWTVADLLAYFGPIAHRRVRQDPAPGDGAERDVLVLRDREHRLYELTGGVLAEKATGVQESYLAAVLAGLLAEFAARHDLGFVLGADGMARLAPGVVRIPDVSLVPWARVPGRRIPLLPVLAFAPALAVEVLSPGNTPQEMNRKLQDYFTAGVGLVWYVDPAGRTVEVFTAVGQSTLVREDEDLTGDPLLPDFVVPLRSLFAPLER